jgi:Bacterial regulatory helix-turn-helix protein, lysR family
MGRRISLAKRLDLVRLVALSVTLVLAIQPVVSCDARCSSGGAASQQQSSTKPVTLEDLMSAPVPGLCRHDAGELVNGKLPLQDPHYGYVAIAHKSAPDDSPQVAFGDLTGDGVDDGAMVTRCSAGGVGWPATVQLYSAGPTRLGGIDLGNVTHGGRESVTDLSISDGVVAEELHFGRAAERLRMSQPPLSQAIRQLERKVGVELLHRTTRTVVLTSAGRAFLDRARLLVGASRAAQLTARRAGDGLAGELRIGAVASAFDEPLPPWSPNSVGAIQT